MASVKGRARQNIAVQKIWDICRRYDAVTSKSPNLSSTFYVIRHGPTLNGEGKLEIDKACKFDVLKVHRMSLSLAATEMILKHLSTT